MKKYLIGFSVLFMLVSHITDAQTRTPLLPEKTSVPPVIDGILNDEIWKIAPEISGFRSFIPDFGKELPYNTIVKIAYDDENVYFAFKCYDNEPDKIRISMDARDKIVRDDWVCINLDSFNDQQTLYCFYANANGIQMDTRFAAGKEDLGMDFVWFSAGKVDSDGYTVEIKLPLKSIRFSNKEPLTMSAFFERYVSRLSTHVSFPELDPARGFAFFGQMQPMQFEGVKHYKLLEILPAATYSYKSEESAGKRITTENKPDAGITVKYGITSQMVLDATLNPDFSQVEADAGQIGVNLRHQLFYAEKRPFFQEGNENFQVGSSGSSLLDPVVSMVHTRNIVNPLVGVKLSGKIGVKNSVSLLYSADRVPGSETSMYGDYAHFPVFRYKRSLKDDGFLGLVATSVLKDNSFNYVYGADGNLRVNKSSLLEFHSLFSNTNDTASGINNKSGHALGISYHSEQRNIDYSITAKDISENFISQTGFIQRTGVTLFTGSLTPKFYPESKLFKRFDFGIFSGQLRDNIYDKWETYNSLSFASWLGGSIRASLKLNYSTEIFANEKFNTSGMQFLITGTLGTKINGSIIYSRRDAIYYSEPLQGYGNVFSGELRYLPFEKLHTQVNVTYQDLYNESDNNKLFDYLIARGRVTYQLNKYLFFRGIIEYDNFRESLKTDFLASFTYIPGTVFHIGYGNLYESKKWNGTEYYDSDRIREMKRGFFVKLSYLFRL
jgi:hypothetical protein